MRSQNDQKFNRVKTAENAAHTARRVGRDWTLPRPPASRERSNRGPCARNKYLGTIAIICKPVRRQPGVAEFALFRGQAISTDATRSHERNINRTDYYKNRHRCQIKLMMRTQWAPLAIRGRGKWTRS